MFGIEIFSGSTLGIDADFKSLTFLRKGRISNAKEHIECAIDEVVVVRPIGAANISCEAVLREGNRIRYVCFINHTKDYDIESKRWLNVGEYQSKQSKNPDDWIVEYFIFGAPRPSNTEYGIEVYNERSELVFSSAHRYMHPISIVSTKGNGDGRIMQEREYHKFGVMLSCFPTFLLASEGRTRPSTLGICYGDWHDGERLFGVRPVPPFFEGGGSAYILPQSEELQYMVVDLSNL